MQHILTDEEYKALIERARPPEQIAKEREERTVATAEFCDKVIMMRVYTHDLGATSDMLLEAIGKLSTTMNVDFIKVRDLIAARRRIKP